MNMSYFALYWPAMYPGWMHPAHFSFFPLVWMQPARFNLVVCFVV
jgi:hypothetical protein